MNQYLNRLKISLDQAESVQIEIRNPGCPFIGVCLPSFLWNAGAGANLVVMKSKACDRMVSMPLDWMYWRSLSVNLNRDRNLDFFRVVRAVAQNDVDRCDCIVGIAFVDKTDVDGELVKKSLPGSMCTIS